MNLVLRNGIPAPRALRSGPYNEPFERLMDSMFEEFLAPWENQESVITNPRMDIVENERAYVVQTDIPGVAKKDIRLSVDHRRVSIEAEVKRETSQTAGENILHAERMISKFTRSFTLPTEVDENQADAKLENGVLTLTLPKKEAALPKKIAVQ